MSDSMDETKPDDGQSRLTVGLGDTVVLIFSSWWGKKETDEYVVVDIIKGDFGSGYGVRVTPAIQENHPLKCDVFYDAAHFTIAPNVKLTGLPLNKGEKSNEQ